MKDQETGVISLGTFQLIVGYKKVVESILIFILIKYHLDSKIKHLSFLECVK